jgi:hypothetical protein
MPVYARKASLVTACAIACLIAVTYAVPALSILDGIVGSFIVLGFVSHLDDQRRNAVRVDTRADRRRRRVRYARSRQITHALGAPYPPASVSAKPSAARRTAVTLARHG